MGWNDDFIGHPEIHSPDSAMKHELDGCPQGWGIIGLILYAIFLGLLPLYLAIGILLRINALIFVIK